MDPFARQALIRRELEKKLPLCNARWYTLNNPLSELHVCKRIFGHRANHMCACGASRGVIPRKKR
jgi:hypothetical protein